MSLIQTGYRLSRGLVPIVDGDTVRLARREAAGMAVGSEGIFLSRYPDRPDLCVVRFWDGGPLTVSVDSLELVRRRGPEAYRVDRDDR